VLVAVIAGCKQAPQLPSVISPYKIDIQQGNVVTQGMVAKLKVGMTRSQVRFVLGSPLVIDPFHSDRWDYVYLYQKQGVADERRRLTVIFDEDKLVRLGGDVVVTDVGIEEVPAEKPTAPVTPVAKPQPAAAEKPAVPKSAAAKPVEKAAVKPPVTAAPAAKPVEKPPVAATPAAKPDSAAATKPAAPKPDAAKTDAAANPAPAGAPPAAVAKPDGAKADSAKTDAPAATADDTKEKPKEKGFFGRMLDKIGF